MDSIVRRPTTPLILLCDIKVPCPLAVNMVSRSIIASIGINPSQVEQLVLPMQCRKAVLQLAHEVPLAAHLGKNKTAKRILSRFYWPNLYRVLQVQSYLPESVKAEGKQGSPHSVTHSD